MNQALSTTTLLSKDTRCPSLFEWRTREWPRVLRALGWLFFTAVVVIYPFDCAAARWYEDYQRAVDLIGDGECSREALQLLGAAVVDKKKPRLNVFGHVHEAFGRSGRFVNASYFSNDRFVSVKL